MSGFFLSHTCESSTFCQNHTFSGVAAPEGLTKLYKTPMKICNACGIEKLETEFPAGGGNYADGYYSSCRICRSLRAETARASIVEKQCLTCRIAKPASEFWKAIYKLDGLQNECRACTSADLSYRFQGYRRRPSKYRQTSFELTLAQFDKITSSPCAYCGQKSPGVQYVGIDRIDNDRGYTLDNCAPCCEICNRMKLTMRAEAFMAHVRRICTHTDTKTLSPPHGFIAAQTEKRKKPTGHNQNLEHRTSE